MLTVKNIKFFQQVVGKSFCLTTDNDAIAPYLKEQRNRFSSQPTIVLLPQKVEQIQQIVRYCNQHKIAVIPQGGNTGLVGGTVASQGSIIINLKNLNKIRACFPNSNVIVAEAGCTLQQIKDFSEMNERSFPLGLSVDNQCQIGGNIASNAGGLNTIMYGSVREMILGIEAVMPDGALVSMLHKVRKNNTGFDDKQLFVGTEGIYGIITAASLRLYSMNEHSFTYLIGLNTIEETIHLFNFVNHYSQNNVSAFELIGAFALELVLKHRDFNAPLDKPYPWYVLIQTSQEISIPNSVSNNDLWEIRAAIPWVQREEGASIKHDISVPLHNLAAFFHEADRAVTKLIPGARLTPFGHMGDSNIHYNVMQPAEMDKAVFLSFYEECNNCVHDIVLKYDGSISAEHGIGIIKQEALKKILPPAILEFRQSLKQLLDPNNIMNPGKGI